MPLYYGATTGDGGGFPVMGAAYTRNTTVTVPPLTPTALYLDIAEWTDGGISNVNGILTIPELAPGEYEVSFNVHSPVVPTSKNRGTYREAALLIDGLPSSSRDTQMVVPTRPTNNHLYTRRRLGGLTTLAILFSHDAPVSLTLGVEDNEAPLKSVDPRYVPRLAVARVG